MANEIEFPANIRLPLSGTEGEIVTLDANGVPTLGGATVADISGSQQDPVYFNAYDNTGGQTFTTGTVTLNLSERINSGQFTLASDEITIDSDITNVLVTIGVSTEINSGSARSTSRFFLEVDTGSGFAEIAGTRGYMYNRTAGNAAATGHTNAVLSFNAGDIIRIRVERYTGGDTITTIGNGSAISIVQATGAKGPKGDPGVQGDIVWQGQWSAGSYVINDTVENNGSSFIATSNTTEEPSLVASNWDLVAQRGQVGPPGSGSTINVFSEGAAISGSPFETINFGSSFEVVAETPGTSGGQANISINNDMTAGTAFPLSPTDGQSFYRTDLQWQFYYDGAKSKWLGELEWDGGGFNGNVGNNNYLRRWNGMTMSATLGIHIPYNITIIGISLAHNGSVNGDLFVRRNGVNVAGAFLDVASTATASDMTLDADMTAGGVMSLYWTNADGSLSSPQCRIWYRRRET